MAGLTHMVEEPKGQEATATATARGPYPNTPSTRSINDGIVVGPNYEKTAGAGEPERPCCSSLGAPRTSTAADDGEARARNDGRGSTTASDPQDQPRGLVKGGELSSYAMRPRCLRPVGSSTIITALLGFPRHFPARYMPSGGYLSAAFQPYLLL